MGFNDGSPLCPIVYTIKWAAYKTQAYVRHVCVIGFHGNLVVNK